MRTEPGCRIDADLAAFLEGAVMIILGTGAKGVPAIGRGVGARVGPEGRSLQILVSAWQWPGTVAQARQDGRIAATFARPADYVTYQVKGRVERVAEAGTEDQACAARYMAAIAQALAALGLPPERSAPWRSDQALTVLHIRPEALFWQTPGPRAGHPLSAA